MALTTKLATAFSMTKFWIDAPVDCAERTPKSLVDFVFGYRGVAPLQVRSELLEFASIVQEARPKALLEIGTCYGGTLFVLCQLADPKALVISLDLPGGSYGGGYGSYRVPVLNRMKQQGQQLQLLRTDSHSPETAHRIAGILGTTPLDLLFIDGDHSYQGVKQDFEMYSPFVKTGGIVAFHDIAKHPPKSNVDVDRFWNEIKTKYRHKEIVEDPEQGWGGIGVLFL
jgi:cephalosporin hydroxylase